MKEQHYNKKNIVYCPYSGRSCLSEKCSMWQKYSDVYNSETAEAGECMFRLATEAIIKKMDPEITERFFSGYIPVEESEILYPFEN